MATRVDNTTLIQLTVFSVIGFVVFRALTRVTDKVTAPLANLLAAPAVWWVNRNPVLLAGDSKYVIQPQGIALNPLDYRVTFHTPPGALHQVATIRYQDEMYKLGPRDERGHYPAWKVQA